MINKILARGFAKALTKETIGTNVKNTEYAVRGFIVQKAEELALKLEKGEKLPFKKLLYCNIGNPLSLGQPTFTFDREVIAVAMNPLLLKCPSISKDARDRAEAIIHSVEYPHALGAYTSSPGLTIVRNSIKRFIEERDGYEANINNIFLTNGASEGVTTIFNTLVNDPRDSVIS